MATVAKLPGHAPVGTTGRCAHLSGRPVADPVSGRIYLQARSWPG